jgi:hypothetical protein
MLGAYVYKPRLDVESRGVPGDGPEIVRRDVVVLERDSEKKRRVDEVRFGGAKSIPGGDSGGELRPPRCTLRRAIAASQRAHGCVCDSPRWPQPLCCV